MITIKKRTQSELEYFESLRSELRETRDITSIQDIFKKYWFFKVTKNHYNNKENSIFIYKNKYWSNCIIA